jgi:hypothetical protein
MREQRIQNAINSLKKSVEIAGPVKVSQQRRHMLMASGMTHGMIERLIKGAKAEAPTKSAVAPVITNSRTGGHAENQMAVALGSSGSETIARIRKAISSNNPQVQKLAKAAYKGYRSLVQSCLAKGYGQTEIMKLLNLTGAEYEELLQG